MLGGGAFDASCAPPVQSSDHLTVGTFDANQQPSKSIGRVRFKVVVGYPSTPADEADVQLHMEMSDVRRQAALDDYTGQLTASVQVEHHRPRERLGAGDPATVTELPFEFVTGCVATADTTIGGSCVVDTSADAVLPGAIKEGFRSAWELERLEVYDGGADGVAGTRRQHAVRGPGHLRSVGPARLKGCPPYRG